MNVPGVRVWFRDEIEAAMLGVASANWDIADAIDTPEMAMYQRGFQAALNAMAANFQVSPPTPRKTRQVQQ